MRASSCWRFKVQMTYLSFLKSAHICLAPAGTSIACQCRRRKAATRGATPMLPRASSTTASISISEVVSKAKTWESNAILESPADVAATLRPD